MKSFMQCLLVLVVAFSLRATPIAATFTAGSGVASSGYYVGPYSGTLSRQSEVLDCVDFANDISVGQQWNANLSHIDTQADLANTRFGARANALQLYQEAAWLTEQYALNPESAWAQIQDTIWQLFDASAPAPSIGSNWLSEAQATYASGNYANFYVVTNVGPVAPTGQEQEFLVYLAPASYATIATPEPRFLGLVGLALICLTAMLLKRRRPAS